MKNVGTLFLFFALLLSTFSLLAQWDGSTGSNGNIYRTGKVGIGGTSPEQLLTLSASNEPVLRFEREDGYRWDFEIYATNGGQLRFRGGTNGTGSQLTDRMVLNGHGKLMVGTENAPAQLGALDINHFRLFVAGGILTEEVIVRTNWADYVFASDYELLSLSEVADHIAQKGHLHNTPSAAEVETNGLQLGAMMVNQQEKIEELFLHLIALEKRVEQLEREKETLKAR